MTVSQAIKNLRKNVLKLTQIEFFILMLRYFLHENEFDENFLFFGKYKIVEIDFVNLKEKN